ncbi:MAG: hypothetical protein JW904_06390 [Spirochaetales bacterium]|nr:hypothetical protein [Spirochaetales bacterium]
MTKHVLLIISFFLLTGITCFAQTPLPDAPEKPETPDQPVLPVNPTHVPEPYTEEEFPEWMLDLRRGEIVFFGTMPFSFLIALEAVDIGRYYAHDQDRAYAPWPFRDATAIPFSVEEQLWIVGTALFISLSTAVVDFFINKAFQAGQRKDN